MHWWLAQLSCQRAAPWPLWFTHRDRSTWNYGIPLTTSLVTISSWPVWPTPSGLACPLVLRRCKTISSQFLSFIILRTNEFLYFSLPFYSIPLYRSIYIQVINDELDSVFFSQTLLVRRWVLVRYELQIFLSWRETARWINLNIFGIERIYASVVEIEWFCETTYTRKFSSINLCETWILYDIYIYDSIYLNPRNLNSPRSLWDCSNISFGIFVHCS